MNNKWNVSGMILEGVCGTGKSTNLQWILEHERFVNKPFLSSVVLSEHQTQRVLERKDLEEGLTKSDNLSLLEQHVSYLESLAGSLDQMVWCDKNSVKMKVSYILERFHFTHVYHYDHIAWSDVEEIDSRLARLNCKLCLFTMDEEVMEERIITSRNEHFRQYISRFGRTNREIVKHFIRQQEELLQLAENSKLETLILNTTAESIYLTRDKAMDFWGAL